MKAQILGFGSYAPTESLPNEKLATVMGIDSDWVVQNIGIKSRQVLGEGESTVTMAAAAAQNLFETLCGGGPKAGLLKERGLDSIQALKDSIRTIVCATNTPPEIYPSTGAKVQDALGLEQCYAFDLQAGCTGWLYGVNVARGLIPNLQPNETILVLGTDALSTQIHYHDKVGSLFGDGAGAALVAPADGVSEIIAFDLGSVYSNSLEFRSGYTQEENNYKMYAEGQTPNHVRPRPTMNGKEVLKLSLTKLGQSFERIFAATGLSPQDIDWFVPHQTNMKVVQKYCEMLGFPFEKVPITLDTLGSISTAGIPTHFGRLTQEQDVKPGDLVLMCSYGAGFTYGSALFKF